MLRAIARGLGELLITLGALLLLFVAWQLWWTDVQSNQAQAEIATELRHTWHDQQETPPQQAAQAAAEPVGFGDPPAPAGRPATGSAFAILYVPRFGSDYERPILQGTSLDLLARGVGHYPTSALPGQVGNFAVAGHRVTYGRPFHNIAELRPGDPIVVETADAWYVYRMRSNLVVTPNRVDVVAPVPGHPEAEPTERLLTMTACHPMYSARQRFVVHAVLDHWQPKSAGQPAELAASGGSGQAG